jgi:hypothetical protein
MLDHSYAIRQLNERLNVRCGASAMKVYPQRPKTAGASRWIQISELALLPPTIY